jgi:GT2 family glycosyltransferase
VRTCNRGFEAARGDYVVFLNNDTQVKPRWLDELYETLQRDDKIGIAGSKLHTRTAASRNAAASCGGSVTDGIGGAIRTPTIRVSATCATPITSPARH